MRLLPFFLTLSATLCLGFIALHRGESINALWFLVAAISVYLLGYRYYSAWIAARVLCVDGTRATPARRFEDGRDFVPTHRLVVFGHHFAAIAGPGPLIGPTLAAQFGYLPGTLWIVLGAVIAGCVQDMVILFLSTRRDGRSLAQMAREEMGALAGSAALIGTLAIVTILISVLALVIVKAMHHSPWGTATVFATIPIAMLVGIYTRYVRVGAVAEASFLGVALLLGAVWFGQYVHHHPVLAPLFTLTDMQIAWFVMGYGVIAAVLPVWLLLAPRDYLSTFLKLGTIFALAIAILVLRPELHMPALTRFIDGSGPVFAGSLFPFVFITIACGAISGFHSLVASGTTPKLLARETDIRLIGYGSMALESFVALMALIAACALEPGVYFAINSAASIVGTDPQSAVATISAWGFPVTLETMQQLAEQMGEHSLFARTGGAPSFAVGMAAIFGRVFGNNVLSLWYHFAIMFEAVFILTTLDAGTRVARFMVQDALGLVWKPLARTAWYPSIVLSSVLVVLAWGYFLYVGVIDPQGGVNILWPLFGIANQMLAGIALSAATIMLFKTARFKASLITGVPLLWIAVITSCAAWEKIFSDSPRMGYFAAAQASADGAMRMNHYLLAGLTVFFSLLLWILVFEVLRMMLTARRGAAILPSTESSYVAA